jgi:hypothetical protein
LVEGQEEWEVEKVLDSRRKGRRKDLQCLLKWRGYADTDNTWEDADQVFAKDLISQFHKENPKVIKVIRFKEGDEMAGNASSETSGPSPSHPSIASVLTSIDFSSPAFQTYRVPRMSGASSCYGLTSIYRASHTSWSQNSSSLLPIRTHFHPQTRLHSLGIL